MGRYRNVHSDISTDPRVAELAEYGALPALLYTWAFLHADDWGRLTGDARQFRLTVCPGFDFTVAEVETAIQQITATGLWARYQVDGRFYIAFPWEAWVKHQSYINKKKLTQNGSKLPPPPGWEPLKVESMPHTAEESQSMPESGSQRQSAAVCGPSPSPSPSPSKNNPPNPLASDEGLCDSETPLGADAPLPTQSQSGEGTEDETEFGEEAEANDAASPPPPKPRRARSDPDAPLRELFIAYREVRHPRADASAIPGTEFAAVKSVLRRMHEQGVTPADVGRITQAAIDKFKDLGMVSVPSIGRNWTALDEYSARRSANGGRASPGLNAHQIASTLTKSTVYREFQDDL